jgi:hypothetical protein
MTEADLLAQLNSTGEFLWSLMQYWTSISIGILIGAYLAAKRINTYFLGAFILVYVVFTGQITWLMILQLETIRGVIIDLQAIEDSAVGLSNTAMAVLEHSPMANDTAIGQFLRLAMFVGMFLITISYPIYCKFKPNG